MASLRAHAPKAAGELTEAEPMVGIFRHHIGVGPAADGKQDDTPAPSRDCLGHRTGKLAAAAHDGHRTLRGCGGLVHDVASPPSSLPAPRAGMRSGRFPPARMNSNISAATGCPAGSRVNSARRSLKLPLP